jgi:hypothetical protein
VWDLWELRGTNAHHTFLPRPRPHHQSLQNGFSFAPWKENLSSVSNSYNVSVVDRKTNGRLITLLKTKNKPRILEKLDKKKGRTSLKDRGGNF